MKNPQFEFSTRPNTLDHNKTIAAITPAFKEWFADEGNSFVNGAPFLCLITDNLATAEAASAKNVVILVVDRMEEVVPVNTIQVYRLRFNKDLRAGLAGFGKKNMPRIKVELVTESSLEAETIVAHVQQIVTGWINFLNGRNALCRKKTLTCLVTDDAALAKKRAKKRSRDIIVLTVQSKAKMALQNVIIARLGQFRRDLRTGLEAIAN
jgi:hypothetical protein